MHQFSLRSACITLNSILYTPYVLVDVHNFRISQAPRSFNPETDFVYKAFLTKTRSKVDNCLVQHVAVTSQQDKWNSAMSSACSLKVQR